MQGDFRLGDWLIQPQLNRIEGSEGKATSVEPKAMEVLVYLAKHSEEVLPKGRVIQAVWPDTFVTDDVLAHAISELRKALGDDAKAPRVIQTIPRRGYRLMVSVFEISSIERDEGEGPVTDELGEESPTETKPTRRWAPAASITLSTVGLLSLAFVVYWWWNALRPFTPSDEHERTIIAVLPFDNLSPEGDDEWFANGITEDITAELSRIAELQVIARTSAFHYKDTQKSLGEVADELGVTFLLVGSVRRADGRVKIVAQLIEPRTKVLLWSETYDREEEHVFEIQSDVARQIAGALKAELSPEAKAQIEKRPTENLEAYNLYQQGRFLRFQTDTNVGIAADYFRQATEKDPNFALAYAALAECYSFLSRNGHVSLEKAEGALERAFKLEATLPDAYSALGQIRMNHYYDWAGAEEALKKALELNPNHWLARRMYGLLLERMGRYAEALVERKRAHQLDPVAPFSNSNLASSYLHMGESDRAIELYEKLVELYPEQDWRHHQFAAAYAEKGLFDQALEELEKVKPPNRKTGRYLMDAGYIHALMGNRAEAQKYVERLESLELSAYDKNRWIAKIFVGLRDYEEALGRLEKAWVEDYIAPNLNRWYWTAPLRDDPRFKELLRRINLEP